MPPNQAMWDHIIKIAPEQLPNAAIGVTATLLLLLLPTLFLLWTRRPIKQAQPEPQANPTTEAPTAAPTTAMDGNPALEAGGASLPSSSSSSQLNGGVSHALTGTITKEAAAPKALHGCGSGDCACAATAEAFSTSTNDHEKSNPAGMLMTLPSSSPLPHHVGMHDQHHSISLSTTCHNSLS